MDPSFDIPKVQLLKLLQYKMDSGTGNEVGEQEKHGGGSVSSEIQRRLWVKHRSGVQVGQCSNCVQVNVKVRVKDCFISWGVEFG